MPSRKLENLLRKTLPTRQSRHFRVLCWRWGQKMDFPIADIYELDLDRFNLAMEILQEWRLDRYYAGKAKLFDISMQTAELRQPQQ